MRKTGTIGRRILIVTAVVGAFVRAANAGDLVLPRLDMVVVESADGFRGTWESLPEGFAVSKDNGTLMGKDDADFRGACAGGVTVGGCYAWQVSPGDYVLGCQPTEEKFTPGYFMVVVSNATGEAVRSLSVSYDIVSLNNADRLSALDLEWSLDGRQFSRVTEASFVTPQKQEQPALWKTCSRAVRVRFAPSVAPGARVWLCWRAADGGGSGSRDEYGIHNIRITPKGPEGTVISFR